MDLVSGGQSVLGSAPAARLLEAITVPPIWVPDEAAAGIAAATRTSDCPHRRDPSPGLSSSPRLVPWTVRPPSMH